MFRTLLYLALTTTLVAQSGLDRTLVFTGTTATSGPDTFAWLVWQPSDPLLISGHTLALYRKTGNAASTTPYSRVSIIEPAADARLITALLSQAQRLGQDLVELNTIVSQFMEDAPPAAGVTLAEKISALITGAHGNRVKMQRLILLGRQHPAIALCVGMGTTDRIPASGAHTYELRDHDLASGTDIGVLGRVTVDHASLLVLPAPGQPYEVADESPKGNLNISLRWSMPNALRDLAPMHYGYDVYRVPAVRAVALGWNASPPASTAILTGEPLTRKVNTLAVLPTQMLTSVEATNPADITTIFLNDDNARFRGGSVFADGAGYFYFAVARDLLGRGGLPSVGLGVTIHDRLATNPPKNVRVRNVAFYNGVTRSQRFFIEWDAPTLPAAETVSAWYVYRWRTPEEIPAKSKHRDPVTKRPDRNLIAILPVATRSLTDDGSVAAPAWAEIDEPPPSTADDLSKTYYYTIRAMDGSASGNLSGHSAPVFGVLRDREGPAGTAGTLNLTRQSPTLAFTSFGAVPQPGLNQDRGHFTFLAKSMLTRGLAWAEFQSEKPGGVRTDLGRASFARDGSGKLISELRKEILNYEGNWRFWCRVATTGGVISDWVPSSATVQGFDSPTPKPSERILVRWDAGMVTQVLPGADADWEHSVVDPATGATFDITGTFTPTLSSREWKLYRRVDNGPQTLVTSGQIIGSADITWTDPAPPASNCTVCYFLQLYDVHGNPGPLTQQGECVESGSETLLSTPMLQPIVSLFPSTSPRMSVKWFANTAGVERFEVWVGRQSGELALNTNSGLSDNLSTADPNELAGTEGAEGIDFAVFQTGLARHLSPSGTPEFEVKLPVSASDTYIVLIRAVGTGDYDDRRRSEFSNLETFTYTVRDFTLGVQVPWPDRPLPAVADFHDGIEAAYLSTTKLSPWKGNAVRIGEYADNAFSSSTTVNTGNDQKPEDPRTFNISTYRDPEFNLYTNTEVAAAEPDESPSGCILPIVMYRVQIANTKYPTVPGDLVQVTPLMEKIANIEQALPSPRTVITDPFVSVLHSTDTGLPRTASNFDHDVLLLDRQPVLRGAAYKYLLVRLSPTKEIERVISTNSVTVP